MKINHNMGAMTSGRNMKIKGKDSSKSMEKLSSGLRISSAGDDAAGLSISEKMRAQIRGLEQASINAADGICLIQTADGALAETHSILERMRELSVQAVSDTNTESDRKAIQEEMNELTSEINRIANNTEYNTKKILIGGNGNGVKPINLDFGGTDVTYTKGNDAISKNMKVGIEISNTLSSNTFPRPDTFDFDIQGINLGVTFVDSTNSNGLTNVGDIGYSVQLPDGSLSTNPNPSPNDRVTGGLIVISTTPNGTINANDVGKVAQSTATLIQKQVDTNDTLKGKFKVYSDGSKVIVEALDMVDNTGANIAMNVVGVHTSQNGLSVKDQNTGQTITGGNVTGQDIPAKGASTTIDFSRVAATLNDIKDLVDTGMSIDGQTIQFFNSVDGPYMGKAIGIDIKDVTNPEKLVDEIIAQTQNKLQGVDLTKDGNKLVITSQVVGANSKLEIFNGNSTGNELELNLQVGANESESVLITISEMTAKALRLVGPGDGYSNEYKVNDGNGNYECALDVTTSENAEKSIRVIDNASKRVSEQRGILGAYQNRLEYVVDNLKNSAENTISSESKIRDTDMALEITRNLKSNVLLQAAQSMMAQANSAPEQIIQLLR